jgi:hypothetical protein
MTDDATLDGRLSDSEVVRRLPEVRLIDDDDLRDTAIDAIARAAPDYFWEVPATGSGRYHNPLCRQRRGLWIHVKQTFTAYERMVDSYVEQELLDEHERDLGRIAVLCHDLLKYGHSYEDGDSTESNHDELIGFWLAEHTDFDDRAVRACRTHNGPWYDGPEPVTPLERLVHEADMVASTGNITVGVFEPSDEIAEAYPSLPRADL